MRRLTAKIRPAAGFAHALHLILTVALPLLIFILVRINVPQLAIALILLSKWRMLAVRPRHWLANIRANAVDLVVGLSTVVFMTHSGSQLWQLIWAVMYAVWLILIKPGNTLFSISIQALIAQAVGLMAVFLAWGAAPLGGLVIAVWVVCYMCARHFFTSFDEPFTRFLSNIWAYFGAALTWVLGQLLLFYGVVAQPTLLLTVIGVGLATIYYLEKTDRLSILLRRQLTFIMIAVIIVVLAFSDWGDKVI